MGLFQLVVCISQDKIEIDDNDDEFQGFGLCEQLC